MPPLEVKPESEQKYTIDQEIRTPGEGESPFHLVFSISLTKNDTETTLEKQKQLFKTMVDLTIAKQKESIVKIFDQVTIFIADHLQIEDIIAGYYLSRNVKSETKEPTAEEIKTRKERWETANAETIAKLQETFGKGKVTIIGWDHYWSADDTIATECFSDIKNQKRKTPSSATYLRDLPGQAARIADKYLSDSKFHGSVESLVTTFRRKIIRDLKKEGILPKKLQEKDIPPEDILCANNHIRNYILKECVVYMLMHLLDKYDYEFYATIAKRKRPQPMELVREDAKAEMGIPVMVPLSLKEKNPKETDRITPSSEESDARDDATEDTAAPLQEKDDMFLSLPIPSPAASPSKRSFDIHLTEKPGSAVLATIKGKGRMANVSGPGFWVARVVADLLANTFDAPPTPLARPYGSFRYAGDASASAPALDHVNSPNHKSSPKVDPPRA